MSATGVTMKRTIGMVRSLYTSALALAVFFAGAGALFAFALEGAEGGDTPLSVLWVSAAAPVLPVLAALLSMEVWSDEKRSGRLDTLLTAPVKERDLATGKFLGVWSVTLAALALFLVSTLVFTAIWARPALDGVRISSFLPGFFALAMQSGLWCAISLAASAMFRSSAAAALTAVAVCAALPRAVWHALLAWAPQGRQAFGEMPLDAHAYDIASGVISPATVLSYVTLTFLALIFTSKLAAWARLKGRGARQLRLSTITVLVLSTLLAGSLIALFERVDTTFELPFATGRDYRFSARTRDILAAARGEIFVTSFMSRKDQRFRQVAHLLRALSAEADAMGGARVTLRYVDPRLDIGQAERLVRMGVAEDSLVFERGRRQAVVPLRDGCGERVCASAILRVAMPPQRRTVYWTRGHGELAIDAYGSWGLSDIARDLTHDGYRNMPINIASGEQTPSDCALIAIAGVKSDFSRAETGWLDQYLRKGGRLLVMLSTAEATGLTSLLSSWGIRPAEATIAGVRTLSGTDVIVSDFSSHPVASPMQGTQVVMEKPIVFTASAAAEGPGAARVEYSELATAGESCVAAASERGAGAGDDLGLRPTRIIAIGDAAFVMNSQLEARANANRDFFMNCIAYLSGTDAITESGIEANRLFSGMDRSQRVRFAVATALVFPGMVFLAAMVLVAARRRR